MEELSVVRDAVFWLDWIWRDSIKEKLDWRMEFEWSKNYDLDEKWMVM